MPFTKAFNLGGCCLGYAQGPEQQHCHWKDQAAVENSHRTYIQIENKAMAVFWTMMWCTVYTVPLYFLVGRSHIWWYESFIYEVCSYKIRTHWIQGTFSQVVWALALPCLLVIFLSWLSYSWSVQSSDQSSGHHPSALQVALLWVFSHCHPAPFLSRKP